MVESVVLASLCASFARHQTACFHSTCQRVKERERVKERKRERERERVQERERESKSKEREREKERVEREGVCERE